MYLGNGSVGERTQAVPGPAGAICWLMVKGSAAGRGVNLGALGVSCRQPQSERRGAGKGCDSPTSLVKLEIFRDRFQLGWHFLAPRGHARSVPSSLRSPNRCGPGYKRLVSHHVRQMWNQVSRALCWADHGASHTVGKQGGRGSEMLWQQLVN